LEERITALAAAEREYGHNLHTAALADALLAEIRQLVAKGTGDSTARRLLDRQAINDARLLISRIGGDSNLIRPQRHPR